METSAQHIMVIDDSLTVCKILEISLKRAGFSVVCFTDPLEALIALGNDSTPLPDLLLLDVLLPHMDGFEVMQYLCQHADLSDIPVVLMSRKNGGRDDSSQVDGRSVPYASASSRSSYGSPSVCAHAGLRGQVASC